MTKLARVGSDRFLLTRVAALILCCAVLLTLWPSVSPASNIARAENVDELEAEKDALAAEQEALEAQRDETAQTLEEQQAQNEILRQQIAAKSQEIAVNQQLLSQLDTQIAEKTARIAEQEAQIVSLNAQIDAQYEALRSMLRSMSKKNSILTNLQLFLSGGTFTEYLINFKISERLSARDQQLMNQLEADIKTVEEAENKTKTDKAALEIERAQVAATQAEMEAGKQELQAMYNEAAALEDQIAANMDELDDEIAALEQQQAALQSTINDILEQIRAEEEAARREQEENGSEYTPPTMASGTMTWPAPTCTLITSSYKFRNGRWHLGTDISCYGDSTGQPIVAAADGTVRYANRYDSWGGGFGYHVMIDHGYDSAGRRIITVYAHCNEVVAYTGQTVQAGDLIGYIGNTGNSFGAHLHFEVQVNGSAVDPVGNGYLSTNGILVLA